MPQICQNLKKSNLQTFSYGADLTFEVFVQYMDYISFVKAMDSLRGMKLLYKGDEKAMTAVIKVCSLVVLSHSVCCKQPYHIRPYVNNIYARAPERLSVSTGLLRGDAELLLSSCKKYNLMKFRVSF